MKWRTIHIMLFLLLYSTVQNQTEINYYTEDWEAELNNIDEISNIISTYKISSYVFYLRKNKEGNNLLSINNSGNTLDKEVEFEGVSSVFQYDNNFFVCPKRGKQIYKIEIGITISVKPLSIPTVIDSTSDFYIKCFQFDEVINIGYINYDGKAYIIPFIYSNNNLSQGKEFISSNKDGTIKAVINRQTPDKKVFIVLLKSTEQVKIQTMEYSVNIETNQPNGNQINIDGYSNREIILYSSNQISLYDNQLLIISFEPNSSSSSYSCNVLSYSPSDKKSKIVVTYNFFPVLLKNDFSIQEAQFFNDETQFFYYLIQSTSTLNYVGVVDSRYNVVIYNSQQDYDNIFAYHLIDNYSYYLGISTVDESKYFCAFFTDNNNNCINSCTHNYIINNSEGNSCSSSTSFYMIDSYSFPETCPIGYYKENDSENKCIYCTKKFDKGKCVENCFSANRIDGTICKSCSDINKLIFVGNPFYIGNALYTEGSCIEEDLCPKFAQSDYINNLCIVCKDSNKYLYNGKCVENCPEGNEIQENNVCFDCQSNNHYFDYFGGKCIDECPSNAEKDETKNVCKICKDNKVTPQFLSIDKKCVDSCGDGMIYDSETNICSECNEGTFSYENSCHDQCPINTKPDPENKKCIDCKKLNQYYFETECYQTCPDYTEANAQEYLCINCKEKGLLSLNGVCVEKSQCPENAVITEKGKCEPCQQYLYDNQCLNSCPPNGYALENNICRVCKDENKYLYNNDCLENCPKTTIADPSLFICSTCPTDNPYIYNETCRQNCPEGAEIVSGNICYYCYDHNLFFYKEKCYNGCPNGSEVNEENNVCIHCADDGRFYFEGYCLEKCNKDSVVLEYNICKSCKESNQFKYKKLDKYECINEMPPGSVYIDKENNIIMKCSDEGKFYENDNCVEECSPGSSYDKDNICDYCKEHNPSQFLFNNTCIVQCPDNLIANENNVCESCPDSSPFIYKNECNNECPRGTETDENYICRSCPSEKPYYYEKKCKEKCPVLTIPFKLEEIQECKPCSDFNKLYYDGKCYEECPHLTVQKDNNSCEKCKEPSIFYSQNKCVESCPLFNEIDYENYECINCKNNNKYYYNEKCYEKCPERTRPNSIDMICEDACLIECFNDGECDAINNKCICKDGYSGKYCEISGSDCTSSKIKIFPSNEAITLKTINIIKYSTTLVFSEGYSLLWKVYNKDNNEEISGENYLNGRKEEMLKLSSEAFNGFTTSVIQLTITDMGTGVSYTGAIEVSFNELENLFDIQIQYKGPSPDSAIAMKDNVLITIISKQRRLSEAPNLLTYCFSFIDMKEEVIPFTYDETKVRDNFYEGVVPYTKGIVITITDSRGQSIDIKKGINIVKDDNYSQLITNIQNNSNSLYQKLLEVYNYIVHHMDENLSEDDVSIINDLIEKGENKLSLAILNYLLSQTKQSNIDELNNLFFKMVEDLKEKINDDITNENVKSFYRNLDGILNSTLNSEDEENKAEKIEQIKESIKILNNYLTQNLSPGETIKVDTSTFQSIIHKPGRNQSSLIINDDEDTQNKNFEDFSDYSIKNTHQTEEVNQDKCNDSTLFCVKHSSYKQLENGLLNLLNTNITNVTFNVIKMNSTQLYKDSGYTPMTTSSVITAMYANNSNEELKSINMDYTLSFKISPEFDITTKNVNSTCVPISSITSQSLTCKTYFNYQTNRTICKCNKPGEIAGLFDYALANFNKLLQFPQLSIDMINPLSAAFVACSLSLIVIFSTILLIYDYLDDKEEMLYIDLTDAEKVKKELIQIKGLKGSKIFGLTWFVTANVFPFFEMIYIYNYNQPRYIRFIIQMISMLVSLLFSIIPYYKTEFTYKQIFIDERDIEKEDWDISNLPIQIWDLICSLIYSIAASISIIIIVSIFSCLLRFKELLLETWKYRKKIILNYIRQNLVTDELTKWNRVKTKIRVVNAFFDVLARIKEIKKTQGSFSIREYNANYGKSKQIYERESFNNFPPLIQNEKLVASMNTDKKSFFIERSGGFSLNGVNEEVKERIITEDKLKEKIKQIKKKYSKTEDMIKMGIHFGRYGNLYYDSSNKSHLGYQDLEIERFSNYSFFNFSDNTVEKKEKCTEKVNILKTIIASLIMMIIISLIYFYLIIMFADIYERYQFYIVKVWLVPSLVNLTLVRLATSFVQNLAYILVVIYFYKTRYQTKLTKFLFKFIIPKYLIYTYKVQMMLNKYDKQLKKDLALKTGKNDVFL